MKRGLCLAFRILAVAGYAALAAWGCLPDKGGTTGAEVRLGNKTLAVLPFATLNRSYFESKLGARLSRDTAKFVRTGCPQAKVLDADGVVERVAPPKAGRFSVIKLGEALKADYVLIGEIDDLSGKPPGSFGVLAGKMVVSARVVDVAARKEVWTTISPKTFRYPPRFLGKEEIPADETEEEVVIRKVMLEAAKGLAAVFTGRQRTLGERVDRELER